VRDCVVKSLELDAESRRRARRRGATPAVAERPHLWAITPNFSPALRAEFGAHARAGLPAGFFSLARGLYTTVVSVALLPEVPETLWLRLLGRGAVQARAFLELGKLPKGHPLHAPTARRMLRWLREAERDPHMTAADRELIMNSERWVLQWERRMIRKGEVKGEVKGLRTAVADLCEVLGVTLTPTRQARLAAMGLDELEALRQSLKQTRRWPLLRADPTRVASPRAPSRAKRSALERSCGRPRPAGYRPAAPPSPGGLSPCCAARAAFARRGGEPARQPVGPGRVGQAGLAAAVGAHDVEIAVAAAVGDKDEVAAVGREGGGAVARGAVGQIGGAIGVEIEEA
jgi:hypothetical protein